MRVLMSVRVHVHVVWSCKGMGAPVLCPPYAPLHLLSLAASTHSSASLQTLSCIALEVGDVFLGAPGVIQWTMNPKGKDVCEQEIGSDSPCAECLLIFWSPSTLRGL